MVGLGIIFSVVLATASRVLTAAEDPRLGEIMDELPGANCGACGYAGCRAYAEAVVNGEEVGLCTVGGQDVAQQVAEIMGVEVGDMTEQRAVVHCQGSFDICGKRAEYDGIEDCRAAELVSGGHKACAYGCLGLGSCASECPFDAITMTEGGLPDIDPDKCTACGVCVKTCPRDLISLLDKEYTIYLGCSSHDKGRAVKNICDVGCIACRVCVKKDPHDAIVMEDNLPVLDHEKAGGDFMESAEACPMDCFVVEQVPEKEPEKAAAAAE
jgi:Na+-translocating ferredoxin:NAD+ oxidoreductase RNF subunit RnfB